MLGRKLNRVVKQAESIKLSNESINQLAGVVIDAVMSMPNPVVSVQDINNRQNDVSVVQGLSKYFKPLTRTEMAVYHILFIFARVTTKTNNMKFKKLRIIQAGVTTNFRDIRRQGISC